MEEQGEFQKLMEEIEFSIKEVRGLDLYAALVNKFEVVDDTTNAANIKRTLTASFHQLHMSMLILGLGSIQYNFASKFNLALALLLRDQTSCSRTLQIKDITVYEPNLNPVESKALKALGCQVLHPHDHDENQGRSGVLLLEKPTLLFMPFRNFVMLGDLLEQNWCPARLNQVIVLGQSLEKKARVFDKYVSERHGRPEMVVDKLSYAMDRSRYVWAIQQRCKEFKITEDSEDGEINEGEEGMLASLAWHFLNIDLDVDMDTLLPATPSCIRWVEHKSCLYRMDEKDSDEALRLQREIEITIEEVKNSQFYNTLCTRMQNDSMLRNEIFRRFGSDEHVQMVIYGLGSLEYNFASHFQLALALSLREDIDILKINEIQVYDPKFSPTDASVMRSFGCTVLTNNEFGRRRVLDKPVIFYTPFLHNEVLANILEVNWRSSALEKMVILCNRLREYSIECLDDAHMTSDMEKLVMKERRRYFVEINDHTTEFLIDPKNGLGPFSRFGWHFFRLGTHVDLHAALQSFPIKEKILVDNDLARPPGDHVSYEREDAEEDLMKAFETDKVWAWRNSERGPSRLRRSWSPPPAGWIKLNFHGGSCSSHSYYGGVFHDERGGQLLSYAGPITDCDAHDATTSAAVEGLRQGLRCLNRLSNNIKLKLVVEGDALSVVRWTKKNFPGGGPPPIFSEAFDEVWSTLEGGMMIGGCVVLHVYEEANTRAAHVASRGANLPHLCVWGPKEEERNNTINSLL